MKSSKSAQNDLPAFTLLVECRGRVDQAMVRVWSVLGDVPSSFMQAGPWMTKGPAKPLWLL